MYEGTGQLPNFLVASLFCLIVVGLFKKSYALTEFMMLFTIGFSPFISLFACLSLRLSAGVSVFLFVGCFFFFGLSVCLFVCLFVCFFVCLSVCLFLCLFAIELLKLST